MYAYLTTGGIEIQLRNTESTLDKIKEYELAKAKFEQSIRNPNLKDEEIQPLPTPQPVDVISMTCVVEPEYGYLVSKFEIVTRHNGQPMRATGRVTVFQKCGDYWYPETYEFGRKFGSFEEQFTRQVTKVAANEQSSESASLPFYGLPEPSARSDSRNSKPMATGYPRWVLVGVGIAVATLLLLGFYTHPKRGSLHQKSAIFLMVFILFFAKTLSGVTNGQEVQGDPLDWITGSSDLVLYVDDFSAEILSIVVF